MVRRVLVLGNPMLRGSELSGPAAQAQRPGHFHTWVGVVLARLAEQLSGCMIVGATSWFPCGSSLSTHRVEAIPLVEPSGFPI